MEVKEIILCMLGYMILVILVLVSVAFLTLLERKILGYIQIRKGPNKLGFMGLPQPFSDAVKLFTKEQTNPMLSNYILYYICPMMSLFLSLLIWLIFPILSEMVSFELGLLFFLCITSMGVYSVMLAGWSSNSNYAMLGGMRAVAQTISYEVSLAMILLGFVVMLGGMSLNLFHMYQEYIWMMFLGLPMYFMWMASCLAETNRTPFDFAEGESELVSGFNVEYSSGGFALIFMSEYSSILFMSMFMVLLFMGGDYDSYFFYLKFVLVSFVFIWIRGTLPRFRYDKLMYLAWKSYLPVTLNYFVFFVGVHIFMWSYWDNKGI